MRISSLTRFRHYVASSCMVVMAVTLPLTSYAAFKTEAKEAILVDNQTGMVLYEHNADERMTPSSMSKLMTLYVLFDRLKHGTLSMDDTMPVSVKAWKKGGSKMFVEANTRVAISDLIPGIVVQSGNDACIVVAEGIAGSEEVFAEEMNKMAEAIGLKGSHFMNSTGWPHEEHYMTARDLATLSNRLQVSFPEYYELFAQKEFTYSGITQSNRNLLLGRSGVDGLKTGHTEDGGYGIAISGEQDGRRLTAVVNGLTSVRGRTTEAERLINYGFREFEVQTPFKPGDVLAEAEVWMGAANTVPMVVPSHINVSLPKRSKDAVTMTVRYDGPLVAPVQKDSQIGTLVIAMPDMADVEVPLLAGNSVEALSGLGRVWPAFRYSALGK